MTAIFIDTCPKCGIKGSLEVISATCFFKGVILEPDGFVIRSARDTDTEEETVRCGECEEEFDLIDLTIKKEMKTMVTKIDSFSGQYDFLSNFYAAKVLWKNIIYPTNEHAFQAAKSNLISERLEIAELTTPGQAKRAGRKVQLRRDWEQIKTGIMKEIVVAKFSQNPNLLEKLIATGDAELTEGNNWGDKIWGQVNGIGENRLGKILMEVREELANY